MESRRISAYLTHAKKALCALLSVCLLWTSGAAEAFQAAPPRPLAFELAPPSRLGWVVDSFASKPETSNQKLVILIQDLHAHYGVQKNIAGILEFLAKKTPFAIAVEGASGPIDSSVMALFPDQKIKQAACDYLMREGELTGAEYFAVMRGLPDALTGVENPDYYAIHRDLFRKTWPDRDRLVRRLRALQAEIDPLKRKVYSVELRRIQHKFNKGDISDSDAFLLKMKLARTKTERDLVQVEHDLALLIRVADLQATEKEVRDFGPRLNQFVALTKALLAGTTSIDEASIRRLISSSIDYYAMALLRNKPMVDNTLALIGHSAPPVAVLVAGGFHTTPITRLLRERNISYLVITPAVDRITAADHDLYVKRLNGELLTEEDVLAQANNRHTELAQIVRRNSALTLARLLSKLPSPWGEGGGEGQSLAIGPVVSVGVALAALFAASALSHHLSLSQYLPQFAQLLGHYAGPAHQTAQEWLKHIQGFLGAGAGASAPAMAFLPKIFGLKKLETSSSKPIQAGVSNAPNPVYLLPIQHLDYEETSKISSRIAKANALTYESEIKSILIGYQLTLEYYRYAARQIRALYRNANGNIVIADESTQEKADSDLHDAQKALKEWPAVFRKLGIKNYQQVVVDLAMLFYGPVIYLKAAEFPQAKVVPADDSEMNARARQDYDQNEKDIQELREWSNAHGAFDVFTQLTRVLQQAVASHQEVTPDVAKLFIDAFVDPEAKAKAVRIFSSLSTFMVSVMNHREEAAARIIEQHPGPVILVFGADHTEGLKQKLSNRLKVVPPDNPVIQFTEQGRNFESQGKVREALAAYQQVVKANPDLVRVHFSIGMLNYELGDYRRAADAYLKVLDLMPDFALAHYNLAYNLHLLGDQTQAAKERQIAIRLDQAMANMAWPPASPEGGPAGEELTHPDTYEAGAVYYLLGRAALLRWRIYRRLGIHSSRERLVRKAGLDPKKYIKYQLPPELRRTISTDFAPSFEQKHFRGSRREGEFVQDHHITELEVKEFRQAHPEWSRRSDHEVAQAIRNTLEEGGIDILNATRTGAWSGFWWGVLVGAFAFLVFVGAGLDQFSSYWDVPTMSDFHTRMAIFIGAMIAASLVSGLIGRRLGGNNAGIRAHALYNQAHAADGTALTQNQPPAPSYDLAVQAVHEADNMLTYTITRSKVGDVEPMLREAEMKLQSAEPYLNQLDQGDRMTFLRTRDNIDRYREANKFELQVLAASNRSGRPFFDIGDSLYPAGFDYDPGIIGHATDYDSLYKIIFLSDGWLKPQGSEPTYFNKGVEGQQARVRINHKPGVVSLVFDLPKLIAAGVRFQPRGELSTHDPVPLRFLVRDSKIHVWNTIQNILEAKNIPFQGSTKEAIIHALGYETEASLSADLGILSAASPAPPAAASATERPASIRLPVTATRVRLQLEPESRNILRALVAAISTEYESDTFTEAGGFLVGRIDETGNFTITRLLPFNPEEYQHVSERLDLINEPATVGRVVQQLNPGEQILGYYHNHGILQRLSYATGRDHPGPSWEDRKQSMEITSRVSRKQIGLVFDSNLDGSQLDISDASLLRPELTTIQGYFYTVVPRELLGTPREETYVGDVASMPASLLLEVAPNAPPAPPASESPIRGVQLSSPDQTNREIEPMSRPIISLEQISKQLLQKLTKRVDGRQVSYQKLIENKAPESLLATGKRMLEEAQQRLKEATQWAESLRRSDDPVAALRVWAPFTPKQTAWLDDAQNNLLPDLDRNVVFFDDPSSFLAEAFGLGDASGGMLRFRDKKGKERRIILIDSSQTDEITVAKTMVHEFLHLHYTPSSSFPSLFEWKLHEGFTEYFTRQALLHFLKTNPSKFQKLWRTTIRQWKKYDPLLSDIFRRLPTEKRFDLWFSSYSGYSSELNFVDVLAELLGEARLRQIYESGNFAEIYQAFPLLRRAPEFGQDFLYDQSTLLPEVFWEQIGGLVRAGPEEMDNRHWEAIVRVVTWFTRDDGRLSLFKFLNNAEEQLGYPLEDGLSALSALQQSVYLQDLVAKWAQELISGKSEADVLADADRTLSELALDAVKKQVQRAPGSNWGGLAVIALVAVTGLAGLAAHLAGAHHSQVAEASGGLFLLWGGLGMWAQRIQGWLKQIIRQRINQAPQAPKTQPGADTEGVRPYTLDVGAPTSPPPAASPVPDRGQSPVGDAPPASGPGDSSVVAPSVEVPQGQRIFNSDEEMYREMSQFKAIVLFLGHGSKSQYQDVEAALKEVDSLVEEYNTLYGKGQWVAVFGGDGFNKEKPDIAHILKYLKESHGVPILAIQSDIVEKQWGGVDKYIDYVRYVPTQMEADGKTVIWGGLRDGKPVGPTAVYLGDRFISGENRLLKGVVTLGGGPIALAETQYAYKNGIPITYVRAATKNPEVNGQFGSLDEWASMRTVPQKKGSDPTEQINALAGTEQPAASPASALAPAGRPAPSNVGLRTLLTLGITLLLVGVVFATPLPALLASLVGPLGVGFIFCLVIPALAYLAAYPIEQALRHRMATREYLKANATLKGPESRVETVSAAQVTSHAPPSSPPEDTHVQTQEPERPALDLGKPASREQLQEWLKEAKESMDRLIETTVQIEARFRESSDNVKDFSHKLRENEEYQKASEQIQETLLDIHLLEQKLKELDAQAPTNQGTPAPPSDHGIGRPTGSNLASFFKEGTDAYYFFNILGAPAWETLVFPLLLGTLHRMNGIELGLIYAAANTIVPRLVRTWRARDKGFLAILQTLFNPRFNGKDVTDFIIRFGLSWLFLLPYILIPHLFHSTFMGLAWSTIYSFMIHADYNGVVQRLRESRLFSFLGKWLPMASITGSIPVAPHGDQASAGYSPRTNWKPLGLVVLGAVMGGLMAMPIHASSLLNGWRQMPLIIHEPHYLWGMAAVVAVVLLTAIVVVAMAHKHNRDNAPHSSVIVSKPTPVVKQTEASPDQIIRMQSRLFPTRWNLLLAHISRLRAAADHVPYKRTLDLIRNYVADHPDPDVLTSPQETPSDVLRFRSFAKENPDITTLYLWAIKKGELHYYVQAIQDVVAAMNPPAPPSEKEAGPAAGMGGLMAMPFLFASAAHPNAMSLIHLPFQLWILVGAIALYALLTGIVVMATRPRQSAAPWTPLAGQPPIDRRRIIHVVVVSKNKNMIQDLTDMINNLGNQHHKKVVVVLKDYDNPEEALKYFKQEQPINLPYPIVITDYLPPKLKDRKDLTSDDYYWLADKIGKIDINVPVFIVAQRQAIVTLAKRSGLEHVYAFDYRYFDRAKFLNIFAEAAKLTDEESSDQGDQTVPALAVNGRNGHGKALARILFLLAVVGIGIPPIIKSILPGNIRPVQAMPSPNVAQPAPSPTPLNDKEISPLAQALVDLGITEQEASKIKITVGHLSTAGGQMVDREDEYNEALAEKDAYTAGVNILEARENNLHLEPGPEKDLLDEKLTAEQKLLDEWTTELHYPSAEEISRLHKEAETTVGWVYDKKGSGVTLSPGLFKGPNTDIIVNQLVAALGPAIQYKRFRLSRAMDQPQRNAPSASADRSRDTGLDLYSQKEFLSFLFGIMALVEGVIWAVRTHPCFLLGAVGVVGWMAYRYFKNKRAHFESAKALVVNGAQAMREEGGTSAYTPTAGPISKTPGFVSAEQSLLGAQA